MENECRGWTRICDKSLDISRYMERMQKDSALHADVIQLSSQILKTAQCCA